MPARPFTALASRERRKGGLPFCLLCVLQPFSACSSGSDGMADDAEAQWAMQWALSASRLECAVPSPAVVVNSRAAAKANELLGECEAVLQEDVQFAVAVASDVPHMSESFGSQPIAMLHDAQTQAAQQGEVVDLLHEAHGQPVQLGRESLYEGVPLDLLADQHHRWTPQAVLRSDNHDGVLRTEEGFTAQHGGHGPREWRGSYPHRHERRFLRDAVTLATRAEFEVTHGDGGVEWAYAQGRQHRRITEADEALPRMVDLASRPIIQDSRPVAYMLVTGTEGKCYDGSTINLYRRVRQHNGRLSGGAERTKGRGPWSVAVYVTGFRCYANAHRFESAWLYPKYNAEGLLTQMQRDGISSRPLGSRSMEEHLDVLEMLVAAWPSFEDGEKLIVHDGERVNEDLLLPQLRHAEGRGLLARTHTRVMEVLGQDA